MSWWNEAQTSKAAREALVHAFFEYAQAGLARFMQFDHIELWVAQYWNDDAQDEVHCELVVKTAEAIVDGHVCDASPESLCATCWFDDSRPNDGWLYGFAWEGLDGALKRAIEPYCIEDAHQDMDTHEAYRPLLRLTRGRPQAEFIGVLQRPWLQTAESTIELPPPDLAPLFEAVYAHAADDGPRLVLADLLEGRGDLRGRFINYQMQASPTDAMHASITRLWEGHGERWLGRFLLISDPEKCIARRGFVSTLAFATPQGLSPAAEDALFSTLNDWPEWNLIEHVELDYERGYSLFPRLQGIDALTVPDAALPAMSEMGPWNCRYLATSGASVDVLARLELPAIEQLELTWSAEALPIDASWWSTLKTLKVETLNSTAVRAALSHSTAQVSITFRPNYTSVANGVRVGSKRLELVFEKPADWSSEMVDALRDILPDEGQGWGVEATLSRAQVKRLNDISEAHWIQRRLPLKFKLRR